MKETTFSIKIEDVIEGTAILQRIERAGRTCYKSDDKITDTSYINFIKMIINNGHESVLEHEKISVRIVCDRGVSHEIVRHRIGSYSQESTRYCNYAGNRFDNQITFITPSFWLADKAKMEIWQNAMAFSEKTYFDLIKAGATPQEARSVLPNSLKTEIVVTYNLREWRHFLKIRTSSASHPQMREIAFAIQDELQKLLPIVFDDLKSE